MKKHLRLISVSSVTEKNIPKCYVQHNRDPATQWRSSWAQISMILIFQFPLPTRSAKVFRMQQQPATAFTAVDFQHVWVLGGGYAKIKKYIKCLQ